MIAVGFLVFRLISDSQHGKADARIAGVAWGRAHRLLERSAWRRPATPRRWSAPWDRWRERTHRSTLTPFGARLQRSPARVTVASGSKTLVDVGDQPGALRRGPRRLSQSRSCAPDDHRFRTHRGRVCPRASRDPGCWLTCGRSLTLGISNAGTTWPRPKSPRGRSDQDRRHHATARRPISTLRGFGARLSVGHDPLVDPATTTSSGTLAAGSRILAGAFIAAALLLALAFSVMASREGSRARSGQPASCRRRGGWPPATADQDRGRRRPSCARAGVQQHVRASSSDGLDELPLERVRPRRRSPASVRHSPPIWTAPPCSSSRSRPWYRRHGPGKRRRGWSTRPARTTSRDGDCEGGRARRRFEERDPCRMERARSESAAWARSPANESWPERRVGPSCWIADRARRPGQRSDHRRPGGAGVLR